LTDFEALDSPVRRRFSRKAASSLGRRSVEAQRRPRRRALRKESDSAAGSTEPTTRGEVALPIITLS
jgi:hypothetical protein